MKPALRLVIYGFFYCPADMGVGFFGAGYVMPGAVAVYIAGVKADSAEAR